MSTIRTQKRKFVIKAGMSIDFVKSAKDATSLQKKYASAFDTDNNKVFSQKEANIFNATSFSERADGTVMFWTRKKDGTKQGKKFNINDKNIKYDVNFDVLPYVKAKSNPQKKPQEKGILDKVKEFFSKACGLKKSEPLSLLDINKETEWKKNYNWSEGCNRKISTIVINEELAADPNLCLALHNIGKKAGFEVKISEYSNEQAVWLEDYSIRRADGKIYILPPMSKPEVDTVNAQNVDRNSRLSDVYAEQLNDKNVVRGKSYLEGGNVLNTRLKNGESGAIIGKKSIEYSLQAMKLEDTPENIEIVKKQIAEDLGLKPENITYISQIDFHIDMFYRPLQDGVVAVPDYKEAIKILKNTNIKGMNKEQKDKLLKKLEKMDKIVTPLINKSNENLKNSGYTLRKIPCFSMPTDFKSLFDKNPNINYHNALCGTSKDGRQYIILNQSYDELNNIITEYYKKAGINDVYFVPTQEYLARNGGIDCLTQEK